MATRLVDDRPVAAPPAHPNRSTGTVEALCAAAGVLLAIIGLAGASPSFDAIAAIAIGAAFLFEAWSVLGDSSGARHERGLWAERVAGWTGVALGILALLHLATSVLVPITVIVFGAGLVLGMGLVSREVRMVVGVGAIVLGILATVHVYPRMLTLIGLIAVAGVLPLTGPAMAWRGGYGLRSPAH